METTTGMSAPPMGMMMRPPNTSEASTISQNTAWLSVRTSAKISTTMRIGEARVDEVPAGQQDRPAAHPPVELQEGDDRAREGDGADGDAEAHLDERLAMDVARLADAEGGRRVERGGSHHHRRKADEAVECGHQLRHGRHGDAPRDNRAGAAADGKAKEDQHIGAKGRRDREQRREMAMAMPAMPMMLPRREVTGLDNPRSARMKSTAETR